jgi:hypothetical protein
MQIVHVHQVERLTGINRTDPEFLEFIRQLNGPGCTVVHNEVSDVSFPLPAAEPLVFSRDLKFGVTTSGVIVEPLEPRSGGHKLIPTSFGSPIAFSSDGKRLACSKAGSVRLIDTEASDPKEWSELVDLSVGIFSNGNLRFSENWRCVVSWSSTNGLLGCAW